jgi:hypothetical protein
MGTEAAPIDCDSFSPPSARALGAVGAQLQRQMHRSQSLLKELQKETDF